MKHKKIKRLLLSGYNIAHSVHADDVEMPSWTWA